MNPYPFQLLKKTVILLLSFVTIIASTQPQPGTPPVKQENFPLNGQIEEGFETLFNGKDFKGWGGPVYAFEVKDGAITSRPDDGGTMYTRKKYSDFILRFEFKLPAGGEGGLAIRYPGSGHPAYVGMCLIVLGNESSDEGDKLDPRKRNGAAYGLAAAQPGHLRASGQWNSTEVRVRSSTVQVELNGTTILDVDLNQVTQYMDDHPHPGKKRVEGHLGLVADDGLIQFRHLRVKPLP